MAITPTPRSKKSRATIELRLTQLRRFIENPQNSTLQRRIAQIEEETLRWAFQETNWQGPLLDCPMWEETIINDYATRAKQLEAEQVQK